VKTALYHVFEMGVRDRKSPVRQVNREPLEIGAAKKLARIGATEGKHDRAVTTNPRARQGFRIVAQYEAKTGDNVTSELYRGVARRKKRVAEPATESPAPAPPEPEPALAETPDAE